MDACFPAEDTPPAPLEGYAERVERYVGLYRGNRIAYSSIGKLNIINNLRRASASEDGLLNLDGDIYVETEPALFVNRQNPDDVIAFRLDESGTATHLLVGEDPIKCGNGSRGIKTRCCTLSWSWLPCFSLSSA